MNGKSWGHKHKEGGYSNRKISARAAEAAPQEEALRAIAQTMVVWAKNIDPQRQIQAEEFELLIESVSKISDLKFFYAQGLDSVAETLALMLDEAIEVREMSAEELDLFYKAFERKFKLDL